MSDKNREPERDSKENDRQQVDFTTTGDGTAWDTGRNSSITDGSRVEKDLREGDAETPGITGPKPNRDTSEP